MATKGYTAYVEKFGIESFMKAWETLPWQAMPAHGTDLPYSIEDDNAIGDLLGRCAANGREVSAKETVDCQYLHDGIYDFPEFNIREKSYDTFLAKIANARILV